jgi:hypothetical protein
LTIKLKLQTLLKDNLIAYIVCTPLKEREVVFHIIISLLMFLLLVPHMHHSCPKKCALRAAMWGEVVDNELISPGGFLVNANLTQLLPLDGVAVFRQPAGLVVGGPDWKPEVLDSNTDSE